MDASYNVKDEAGREQHKLRMFSDHGKETIQNYIITLAKEYLDRVGNEDAYPFDIGIVLGVPFFKYAKTFSNRSEHYGFIKALCQVIGVDQINGRLGDTTVEMRL